MKSIIKVGSKFKDLDHPEKIFIVYATWQDIVYSERIVDGTISFRNDGLIYLLNMINTGRMELILPDNQSCQHEYNKYVGFTDTYNYCVKCDERQK